MTQTAIVITDSTGAQLLVRIYLDGTPPTVDSRPDKWSTWRPAPCTVEVRDE